MPYVLFFFICIHHSPVTYRFCTEGVSQRLVGDSQPMILSLGLFFIFFRLAVSFAGASRESGLGSKVKVRLN